MSLLNNVNDDLRPILPQFIENLKDDLDELRSVFEQGESSEIERVAHGIKGSAASMGLTEIRDNAKAIETAASDNSGPIEKHLDKLEVIVGKIEQELNK